MRILTIKEGEIVEVDSASNKSPSRQSARTEPRKGPAQGELFERPDNTRRAGRKGEQDRFHGHSNAERRKSNSGSFEDVYGRAIYLLAMREHSQQELSVKLRRKFPSSTVVEDVLKRVTEEGFLNEHRFVESFVRSRGNRGSGPQKIRAELREKGISSELLEHYLDQDDQKWTDRALLAYKKKYGDSPIDSYSEWTKRARFLTNRGFTRRQLDAVLPSF